MTVVEAALRRRRKGIWAYRLVRTTRNLAMIATLLRRMSGGVVLDNFLGKATG
jgi:hypothetical protein